MTKSQQGLTLLELLIAVSLMAVLSITTTQMLRKSTVQTKKITAGIDHTSYLRSALNIIKKDVSKSINYRNLNLFLYNEAQKERVKRYDSRVSQWVNDYNEKKKPTPALTTQTINDEQKKDMEAKIGAKPVSKAPKKEVIYTHFVGDNEKLYFTSASGVRFRAADKISDLAEVGYFLRTCKSRKYPGKESKCLWRSISYNLDDDVTKGGTDSVLIENILSAEFKYLSATSEDLAKESLDWVESWDSRNLSDRRTGGKFPAAVSLSLEIEIPTKKEKKKVKVERLTGVFPVNFPNNDPFKKIRDSNSTTQTSSVGNI